MSSNSAWRAPFQVAKILGEENVLWTDNGIAPSSHHSARGGETSEELLLPGATNAVWGALDDCTQHQCWSICDLLV